MKKSELFTYLIISLVCLLLLTGLFIYRSFLSEPLEIRNNAPIVQGEGNGKVNINTADADTLTLLPGIGPATAKNIIDYREKYGLFRKIEDIKNVSGIGDKTYADIRKFIEVGG